MNFHQENFILSHLQAVLLFQVLQKTIEKFPNIDFGFCYNGKYNTLKELKSEF